jgi:hypothetical protein
LNRASLRRIANAGLLSLGVAALGACSAESPAAPGVGGPSLGLIPGGTGEATTSTITAEIFKVCKVYSGTVGPAVSIQVQVDVGNNGGAADHDFAVNVADGECVAVWSTSGNAGVTDLVTVTETVPAGYTASFVTQTLEDGITATDASAAGATTSETITNPGGTGTDGVVVTFTNTELENGCTLTQGYWKTHSAAGPAPFDDGWLEIGALGAGETFFTSGMTWLEIFNTPPSGGNAYLQLAHQYMAAKLNILNGASSTTAVDAAIAGAEAYFAGKAAGVITESNAAQKAILKGWASTLASYNEGAIGPGHCDETEILE